MLEGGNAASFARKIGKDESVVSRMRSGRVSITNSIDGILHAYPAVRRDWLETGEGYPGDISIESVKARYQEKIDKCERIIEHLMRRIEELENSSTGSQA